MKRNSLTSLTIAAAMALAAGANAQVLIRPETAFDPYMNVGDPFSSIPAAVCASTTMGGNTVRFASGLYRETPTITTPVTLTALPGSSAVIGQPGNQRTTLRVLCWNLHLFGDFPLHVWQDEARAAAIGSYFFQERNAGRLDFAATQEVWAGPEAQILSATAAFPNVRFGSDTEGASVLGSGLMLLSNLPTSSMIQYFFDAERGTDANASKGFTQQTVTKDGFQIGVFVTHLQSGDSEDDVVVRDSQLFQLANVVRFYRTINPTHAVIILGDFNIAPGTTEATTSLRYKMGFNTTEGEPRQMADISPNLGPCLGDYAHCTSCSDNIVHEYFYGPGGGAGRIDYIFYGGSRDGTVRIVPKVYDHRRPLANTSISGDGWAPDGCGACTMTTRVLSDHDAVFAEFELHRD